MINEMLLIIIGGFWVFFWVFVYYTLFYFRDQNRNFELMNDWGRDMADYFERGVVRMNIDMYDYETMEKISLGKLRMLRDEDKPEGKNIVLVKMSATMALKYEEGEE